MRTDKNRLLFYFIPLAFFNLIVYYLSFFQLPRSDQLAYLANVANQHDWVSLALKNYAMNRLDLPYDMRDDLLFRPIIYIFLGTEKWLFEYHFIYWQITGFFLHLTVLWWLLKLLLQTYHNVFAILLTTFFSVLHAGVEMVIWTNVHGYLIFIICILISLYQIQRLLTLTNIRLKDILKILIPLTIATFTHELGVIYCILFTIYFYFSLKAKRLDYSKTNPGKKSSFQFKHHQAAMAFLLCIPSILYIVINLSDFYFRGFKLSLEGQSIVQNKNIMLAVLKFFPTLLWWVYVGIFPSQCVTNLAQRTAIFPPFILIPTTGIFPIHGLNLIPIFPGVMVIFIYFFILYKGMYLNYFKDKWKILTLLLVMLFFFALSICFGRISIRGIERILRDNSYYNYFFWVFFTIFIYISIPFNYLKKGSLPIALKRLTSILLVVLILINAYLTSNLFIRNTYGLKILLLVWNNIQNLKQQHNQEADFSFGLDPTVVKIFYVKWLRKTTDPPEKMYNLFELLYPQYYNQLHPKYLLFLGTKDDL